MTAPTNAPRDYDVTLEALRRQPLTRDTLRKVPTEPGRDAWRSTCPACFQPDALVTIGFTEGDEAGLVWLTCQAHECAEAEVHALLFGSNGNLVSAAPDAPASGHLECTDLANAERLVAQHGGDLRYVPGIGWHCWDGRRWRRDDDGEAMRRMKATVRAIYLEASRVDDERERKVIAAHAVKSESEPRLRAALSLAQTEREVIAHPQDLDGNPWLLTVENGTLDLRTGQLRAYRRRDLVTRATEVPYGPEATCPRWQRFLLEVFAGDRELVGFIQRWMGYTLTGDTSEQQLAVYWGAGSNGKSTTIGVHRELLGEHATAAAFDTFTRARGDRGPRNDLARLRGARLVTASESGDGRRLDEATVKEVTGGDTIAARFLYGEHFEYRPAFKLVLVTNHRPRVDGSDDALWRRLRLIPFEESFLGREDRDLPARLRSEMPGILRWALEGCLAWQRDGLGTAAAVTRATDAYRAEEDRLGAFLADRCVEGGEVSAADLRAAYEAFCADLGERALPGNALGRQLAERGIRAKRRTGGRRVYTGLHLAASDGSDGRDGTVRNSPYARAHVGVTETADTCRHPSLSRPADPHEDGAS